MPEAPAAVTVRACVFADIERHARATAPDECCGLLLGGLGRIVESARARNAADMPATRYLIEPEDHFAAIRRARAAGLEVVGAYHSHPVGPPFPSARDVAESPAPDFLHLLAAPADDRWTCRLFLLQEGNIAELQLVTLEEEPER
jgi:proteasome lid subunit RPN8/RPN11